MACRGPIPETQAPAPGAAPESRATSSPASSAPGASAPTGEPTATFPDGVTPGGECPDPGASADAEIAAQASAVIPLVVGLTLADVWRRGDVDVEGLHQVTAIDRRSVVLSVSYPNEDGGLRHYVRRVCRSDLRNAVTHLTVLHEDLPETFVGTVKFTLSRESFLALKHSGSTRHRFLSVSHPSRGPLAVDDDIDGTLTNEGKSTFKVIVNDRTVELPVIEATRRSPDDARVIRVQVLDDERFPLVLDYYMPGRHKFFITYKKISFPTAGELEQHLATDKRVDVYGIYFDFGRDVLRPESEPVLREIADALSKNVAWTLSIVGHTDNVGGEAFNVDLSRRRSEAVRKALVDRFGIDGGRLSASGYGASQPKESNDTAEGRARNRRVELVRS